MGISDKVRARFYPLWPFMGTRQKVYALWLFYRWLAAEKLANWLHKHYDRMKAERDERDGKG